MKSGLRAEKARTANAAFLWDESFLWGLMSYKSLRARALPFDLIRCEDIRAGRLRDYAMLFVPGGWASNKLKALGTEGASEILKFVNAGGNYLGFCGGAGLATLDGLGLLKIKRMTTKKRVPSFSGRIRLDLKKHPVWNGTAHDIFHVWWPSQFLIGDGAIKVLASYREAMPDSFSSDLNVGDVATGGGWCHLEEVYGINLDPARLYGEPAVVEGKYGKGNVLLSLVHFDTPRDNNGAIVLRALWDYLAGAQAEEAEPTDRQEAGISAADTLSKETARILDELEAKAGELIALGERNFLWFWRNPMLLQWRRGVRGLEYCTLFIMMKESADIVKRRHIALIRGGFNRGEFEKAVDRFAQALIPFIDGASKLLVAERLAMQNGNTITYERCDDATIALLRERLFSSSKSYGGAFKKLIDEMDHILLMLLREQ